VTLEGIRVLLVEDEALLSMMLEEFLEEFGCTVVATAARLDDAMAKATVFAGDVGMLDINLAGEMSYPVAQLLQSRKIPFLFATGYGTDGLPDDLKDATVLSKPFRAVQLYRALRLVVGR
jgi:DNA-binding NarL/FixJ family response regulator